MTVQATNYDGTADYTLLQTTDVKNSLTDSSTNLPLSANQGKILKTIVDGKVTHYAIRTISSNEWVTIEMDYELAPHIMIINITSDAGPEGHIYFFVITSSYSAKPNGGRYFELASYSQSNTPWDNWMEFNWNNETSFAVHAKQGVYMSINFFG